MFDPRTIPHPDGSTDRGERRAVVGWSHTDLPLGIDLTIETTRSQVGLENGRVEHCHLVMTDNQALLLARYLLHVTGQTLADPPPPARGWRTLLSRRPSPRT